MQGGRQGGREHLRVVPPASLPYSEGFDSPCKASPTSSTSSASLGVRSDTCTCTLLVPPCCCNGSPSLAGRHFGLLPWKAAQHQCLRPRFACLNLARPTSSTASTCKEQGRRPSSGAQPSCLPQTATPEHVRLAAPPGCCCCVDSSERCMECWPCCAWSKAVHGARQHITAASLEQRQQDASLCSAVRVSVSRTPRPLLGSARRHDDTYSDPVSSLDAPAVPCMQVYRCLQQP